MEERLQKIIAAAGLTSRRAAEELIAAGKVRVNGNVNLTDEWYRLFDIKSGKMYKAPSERITIW